MDTLKHIHAMQETAMALEKEARANGRYSRDCGRVNDAIVRGAKSGVALLWDSAGRLEVVSLNNGADHVSVTDEGEHVTIETNFEGWNNPGREEKHRDETNKMVEESQSAYRPMNEEEFKSAASKSHEKRSTADTARMNAELRKRQQMNSAKERSYRADAISRNEELAARAKAFWNKSA